MGSASPFRYDGLTAFQHRNQSRDLSRAARGRFHVVRAKGQREEVLASECLERLARSRVRIDRCAEILFELDGLSTGAIAVCGFGPRGGNQGWAEFDPLGKAVR